MDSSLSLLGLTITILLGFFSTYIIFDFMARFNRKNYYDKKVYILAYCIYTGILFVANFNFSAFVNLFITFVGAIIIGHFLYNSKKVYLLYYGILVALIFAVQLITSLIFNIICQAFNIIFLDVNAMSITSALIVQLVCFAVSRAAAFLLKKRKIEKFTLAQFFCFLIFPIFSIVYIMSLLLYTPFYISTSDTMLLLFNLVTIVLLNLFIANVFESISKTNKLKSDLLLYETQTNMQYEYYTSLENKYKSSRKTIHDIKNHLQTIEELYKVNDGEKAKEYTEDMYSLLGQFSHKYYTENTGLNIILNDKVNKMESFKIDFVCQIGDINLAFIKDIDLTTIFANLLDNAIRATKDIEKHKLISLKMDKVNEFIVINIISSIDKEPKTVGSTFLSTKKEHEGLGLQNVKMTVEKYEGNMRIDYNNENFKVNIVIPTN